MSGFRVSGTTAATAATDQHAICAIWNPSSTKAIWVCEISICATTAPGAGAGYLVRRITGRGTAGSSVSGAAVHSLEDPGTAPSSGFILDLAAYSVQPTLIASELDGWVLAAVAASGVMKPYTTVCDKGIQIGPGRGLALVNRAAIAFPISEVSFCLAE